MIKIIQRNTDKLVILNEATSCVYNKTGEEMVFQEEPDREEYDKIDLNKAFKS